MIVWSRLSPLLCYCNYRTCHCTKGSVQVIIVCSLKFMPSFSFFSSIHLKQGTVTSLLEENGTIKGVQYKTKDGKELTAHAPLTIVCDGCFSNLRRTLCNPQVWFINLTCRAKNTPVIGNWFTFFCQLANILKLSYHCHMHASLENPLHPVCDK